MLDTTQDSVQSNEQIVNEVCMTVCTVNGSGSATANNILYRALFRMGILTSGKNIFPSNIKGLPTWFVIRASARGYTGRVEYDDVVVAMNPATIRRMSLTSAMVGCCSTLTIWKSPKSRTKRLLSIPCPSRP